MRYLFAVLVLAFGCAKQEPTILFKIPTGFNGMFLVYEDKIGGQIVSNPPIFNVPDTGLLAVKDISCFAEWHKTCADYEGQRVPFMVVSNGNELGLFQLPTVSGKGDYFFFGKREEFEFISRQGDFYKLPMAKKISR